MKRTYLYAAAAVIVALVILLPLTAAVAIALIVAAGVLFSPSLRVGLIVRPLQKAIARKLTPVSDTERTALEAGSAWWEKSLFRGEPDWQMLLDTPAPRLTEAEESFLNNETEQLCALTKDWKVSLDKDLDKAVWDFIKAKKFFGMIIPKQYGGLGFSAAAHSAVVTKLATRSSVLAVTVMVPNSLGPSELLLKYGSEEQRQHYLPNLAQGLEIPCFALTSPNAGSDATSIEDTGVVCEREFAGKPRLGLALNWNKRYITLAPVASLLGLAVKVHDPENLLKEKFDGATDLGITCVLVPTNLSGVQTGKRHNPLETPFQNGPTQGDDVFIPLDYIIGGADMIGQGWRMLVECLSVGRSLSLPALASAASQVALYSSSAYARVREQFKRPLGDFEGIQEALADIAILTEGIDAVRALTVSAVDAGESPAVASAMAKYFTTECSRRAVNAAMDIHGGKAIMCGEHNYLANLYKSIPISITVEGANILTRSLIIFGQGAIRCHPHLLDELDYFEQDGEPDLQKFERIASTHLRYHLRTLRRAVVLGYSRGYAARTPQQMRYRKYCRRLACLSAAFAYLSDLALLTFGGDIKRREMLSGRFADALTMMYASAAILKQHHNREQASSEHDDMTALSCEHYQQAAETALYEICRNLPGRILPLWTRLVLFPFGRRLAGPPDALRRKVARQLLQCHGLRLTLARDLHRDTFLALDHAMQLSEEHSEMLRKLKEHPRAATATEDQWLDEMQQQGVATADDIKGFRAWKEAVAEIIKVDDFSEL